MTLHAKPLPTDDEQNTFTRLLVWGTMETCDDHEGTKAMEPIDHPPGHEIERLNREIDEQYSKDEVAAWDPPSWEQPLKKTRAPETGSNPVDHSW